MQQSRKLKTQKRAKLSNKKQTKKKILPTDNNKNKSISNIDKVISTLKLGSVMPNTSSATSNETPYLEAILLPERATNAKIPGLADMSIALHRKLTFNLTTNTLGAAALFFFPYCLSDLSTIGAAGNSSIFFTSPSNLTFDGVTTVGSTNPTASQCNFNITAGSVAQYRCVSASIHIIPQSSVLNQAGSIHASLLPLPAQIPMNPSGALSSVAAQACLIPTLSNTPHYSEASVSAMEGMRVVWLPNDECLLEFANINTSAATSDSNSYFNAMVATIVGTVPASLFRIDCYMNYEIVPTPTSVLVGMETICTHNERPQSTWRNILLKHADDICKPVKSSKVAANSSIGLLGSKMDLLKKFIGNWTVNENSTEFHYPGTNYLGPGTHIITKVLNDIVPTSKTDAVAMMHDIDYLTEEEPIISDIRAMKSAEFNLEGLAMRTGLGIRSVVDALLHIMPLIPNFTHINGRKPDDINMSQEELIPLLLERAEALQKLRTDFNFNFSI